MTICRRDRRSALAPGESDAVGVRAVERHRAVELPDGLPRPVSAGSNLGSLFWVRFTSETVREEAGDDRKGPHPPTIGY